MTHNLTPTCTATHRLDQLLAQVTTWLTPTVEAECRRQDAAALRVFAANLKDARDDVAALEDGLEPGETGLSAALEGLAESFARWTDGTVLQRPAILTFITTFNLLAAQAWAMEVALKRHAGVIDATDIDVLALAKQLQLGAVLRGSRLGLGPQPPERGGAA